MRVGGAGTRARPRASPILAHGADPALSQVRAGPTSIQVHNSGVDDVDTIGVRRIPSHQGSGKSNYWQLIIQEEECIIYHPRGKS